MDDALGIDAHRLAVQSTLSNERGRSRSPAPLTRRGGGRASQNRNENGERGRMVKMRLVEWVILEPRESFLGRERSGAGRLCGHRAQTER